uniref:Odorant receptor n=1 Tax=Aulacocentrum confusum TaxID=2767324 RepID=A0A7G8Z928_9HYME|nr:olfactory receptor 9 [Aulacocentrum confusum]
MNTLEKKTDGSTTVSAKQSAADLDWAIGLNRKVLKIFGLWSYVGETKWHTVRSNCLTFLFVVGSFCFVTLPQTTALIKVWGNMILVVDNLILNVAATVSEVKVVITWLNKKALAKLLDEIKSDWFRKKKIHERQIMIKYANINRIMTILGLLCTIFSVVFCFTPIMFGIVPRTISNLTDKPGRRFPLQAVYLYDTSSIYGYYLTIFSQFLGSLLGSFCYTGIDVIFGMLVLHTCGQLENLSANIHAMINDIKTDIFQNILNTHIQTHYRLIRNVEMIESMFSLILLGLIGSFAVIFSIVGFQIVEEFGNTDVTIPQFIFHLNCLIAFLFFMFIYAWVGEYLVSQSDLVHMAIYNCNWINLTPKKSSQLIILLVRSQHSLQLTAGKLVPLTMSTYVSLLKSCGGYISFLLAVRK